jgi:adenylate cyclase
VREVETQQFCVGGPQVTPHIVLQQRLDAGETRTLSPTLEPGRYRVRARDVRGHQPVLVLQDGLAENAVRLDPNGWQPEELELTTTPALRIENASDLQQLLVLERTAWADDVATAADVTALQVFRDLFAAEALRPGEPISVGNLTVLFTDLRDSTRFYREAGDAPAFGSVLEHLDVMRSAVVAQDGAVVKTMGDAVMAVFRRPAAAVRAALNAQRELAGLGNRQVRHLKVGINCGPCIAVTQNDRLDYFGSTVNAAARLVDLSSGEDVIVSGAVHADPEVSELLAEPTGTISAEPLHAELKGFDERFELWRFTAKRTASPVFEPARKRVER